MLYFACCCLTKKLFVCFFLTARFFSYATIWKPRQLEAEFSNHFLWRTVKAPVQLLFDDDPAALDVDEPTIDMNIPSLYERIIWSMYEKKDPSQAKTKNKNIPSS